MSRVDELRRLRTVMGTAPLVGAKFETRFFHGVEGILVDLVDGPANPYRAMYTMAVSTWGRIGSPANLRWVDTTPEGREAVVRAVLARQALPLAEEAPKFTFEVLGLSRWSFDQIARARIGSVFASLGTRDNNHLDAPFRMHEVTYRDPEKRAAFVRNARRAKEAYRDVVQSDRGSWQEARTWLPISVVHRFTMSMTFASLRGFCARRMSFSEAEDTVAVAWLIRDRLLKADAYPLLGAYLRPACDAAGACRYHQAHSMSEAFGCLFASCGRNPVRSAPGHPTLDYEVADFNTACTDAETLAKQTGVQIPPPSQKPEDFELTTRDRYLFGYPERTPGEYAEFLTQLPGHDAYPYAQSGKQVDPEDLL